MTADEVTMSRSVERWAPRRPLCWSSRGACTMAVGTLPSWSSEPDVFAEEMKTQTDIQRSCCCPLRVHAVPRDSRNNCPRSAAPRRSTMW